MGRWLLGFLVLLLVGLVYGLLTGQARIDAMEGDIRSALNEAGHNWAAVDMQGNVATVSGEAPSNNAKTEAVNIAANTKCSACKNKHKWHNVRDDISVATETVSAVSTTAVSEIPVQSPYTFSARKVATGAVTLEGFVPSQTAKDDTIAAAQSIFGTENIAEENIRIASGAPDNQWAAVIEEHFRELSLLAEGRFEMDGTSGALTGVAPSVDVQNQVLSMVSTEMPEGYSIASNLRVPDGMTRQSGEVTSQAICQNLLNDIRTGRRIQFGGGSADIRGDMNFDLLNDIGGAAQQCPSFRVAINGYTSSDGSDELNQRLSEARANSVLAYLATEAGIDRSRMTATGFGEANPIADNSTAEGRERNRRIEFILSQSE